MLAVAMNGEPLPVEHGFPVRMVVPGLYGYVSATKWVTELELTTFDEQAYWTTRGYAEQAPIKTSSQIDTPKPLARLAAGSVAIAGVAWAQGTGIAAAEVSIDEGPWKRARLAGEAGVDTWRQ
jgi:DMSO/TMAO reductase YedYZ molybdopterin-dependent catalytic subunit